MGGELMVKSVVGEGSLFTFEIPVQVVQTSEVPPQEAHRQVIGLEPGQPCYRILVVDDVADNRQLLVRLLASVGSPDQGSPGFHVREAANGQEALEIWETWQPHLIWMDMRMPVMDGYEATRRIREAEEQKLRRADGKPTPRPFLEGNQSSIFNLQSSIHHVPIIALTASAFEEQRSVVLTAGCDDFLRKPFREIDFFDMMGKYLGLRYVYAAEPGDKTSKAKQIRLQTPFIVEALAALPDELLQALRHAVKEINLNTTQRIIGRIGKKNKALARELSHLLEDYRFDVLLDLVEETKK
jgi:CheY-like chemotaxis protein